MEASGGTDRLSALMIFEAGFVATAKFDMREATDREKSSVPNKHTALRSSTSAARAKPRWRAGL